MPDDLLQQTAELARMRQRLRGTPVKWVGRSVYGLLLLTWLALIALWIHSYWHCIALATVSANSPIPARAIFSERGSIVIMYAYSLPADAHYRLAFGPATAPMPSGGPSFSWCDVASESGTSAIRTVGGLIVFPHWVTIAALLPFIGYQRIAGIPVLERCLHPELLEVWPSYYPYIAGLL
jgi:hypothetical protein